MKKRFSKELFVEILQNLQQESDTLSDLYEKYRIDFIDCDWIRNDISVIKLLEFIFDDEETDWIGWWCWEKDFGRDNNIDAFSITDNIIPLDTPEEFYNFLIENMENKNGRTDIN